MLFSFPEFDYLSASSALMATMFSMASFSVSPAMFFTTSSFKPAPFFAACPFRSSVPPACQSLSLSHSPFSGSLGMIYLENTLQIVTEYVFSLIYLGEPLRYPPIKIEALMMGTPGERGKT